MENAFRKWLPLGVLSLALMIIILDTTILNVSLKTILIDLHTTVQSLQWVITAYSLTLAALTITGGRLGDLFGRKRMFVVGAIIFAIGSFITSTSTSVTIMIWGEAIIEGIGAALMIPATASLLVSTYQGRDRQIGFGIWGGIAAAAAALGPIFGGFLTTYYSWRWAFRINVVVAAVLVLGSFLIHEAFERGIKPKIDFIGIFLSALGLFAIVFAVIEASTYGWIWAIQPLTILSITLSFGQFSFVPFFILAGLIILGLFALWEKHIDKSGNTPLVSLKLFSNTQFDAGTSLICITILGQSGLTFVLPVFLQAVKNLDAFQTGVALLPMPLAILVASPLSGYISKFISPKHLIQIGLVLEIVGLIVLLFMISATGSVWTLAPGLAIFGFGMGLFISQANNIALSAVSIEEAGEASGVNSTSRNIGATFGTAILGAILLSALASNLTSGIQTNTAIPSNLKPTIVQAINKQSSNIEFGSSFIPEKGVPPTIKQDIATIANQATADASKTTIFYSIFVILGALLISLKLPNKSLDA